jgi:Transposase DDE domain group 1
VSDGAALLAKSTMQSLSCAFSVSPRQSAPVRAIRPASWHYRGTGPIDHSPTRLDHSPKDFGGELFPRVGFIVTNLPLPNRAVVRFYNKRGTAEQWIKEGKQAAHWTRLSCHRFRANEVRLQLSVLAYNLGNLWRRLVLPRRIDSWSLTSLQQRLVKTGGRLVRHARYYWLLLAESHLTRRLFGSMLQRIWALPAPTG